MNKAFDPKHCLQRDIFKLKKLAATDDAAFFEVLNTSKACVLEKQKIQHQYGYPELPITAAKKNLIDTIQKNQVTIVIGETGSGKSTQLPKICLEMGLGTRGQIAHTQPRKLAAVSIAERISTEMKTDTGETVGYKVRGAEKHSEKTQVMVMTDGMLLMWLRRDRFLDQFDTIIIDEVHERSLNIDFILGILKKRLKKRRDLKVILTSATLEAEKLSHFFDKAPIVRVPGRAYPVDITYVDPAYEIDDDQSETNFQGNQWLSALLKTIRELPKEKARDDILIFVPGEAQIEAVLRRLRQANLRHTKLLALYARLAPAKQRLIYESTSARKIIVSTNVAETSLTVPGIKIVIDTGLARVSRYSHYSAIQRLPIEPIAKASADQRAGRAGRVAPGHCFRLYSEADFLGRADFLAPMVQRTGLSQVILQMLSLRLTPIANFPFLDAPDGKLLREGLNQLVALQAVEVTHKKSLLPLEDPRLTLTKIGHAMARLPVDPKLARVLIAAKTSAVLPEIVVIVAGLSAQEVAKWVAKQDDESVAKQDEDAPDNQRSDFMRLLEIWRGMTKSGTSRRHIAQFAKSRHLSPAHLIEWFRLARELAGYLDIKYERLNLTSSPEDKAAVNARYQQIHVLLLRGLAQYLGQKVETKEKVQGKTRVMTHYASARGRQFVIHPSCILSKKRPKWVVAFELRETSRVFATLVASIEPAWIIESVPHLLSETVLSPTWSSKKIGAYARIQQSLYGLKLSSDKQTHYAKVDADVAREMFIREAIIGRDFKRPPKVVLNLWSQIDHLKSMEAKKRRADILKTEDDLVETLLLKWPSEALDGPRLLQAIKKSGEVAFKVRDEALMQQDAEIVESNRHPDFMQIAGVRYPLRYHFKPGGSLLDGVTLEIDAKHLNQLDIVALDWAIPALVEEKIIHCLQSLPKSVRSQCQPIADFAEAIERRFTDNDKKVPVHLAVKAALQVMIELRADVADTHFTEEFDYPDYLQLKVLTRDGKSVARTPKKNLKNKTCKTQSEKLGAFAALKNFQAESDATPDNLITDTKSLKRAIENVDISAASKTFVRDKCLEWPAHLTNNPVTVDGQKLFWAIDAKYYPDTFAVTLMSPPSIKGAATEKQAIAMMQAGLPHLLCTELSDKVRYLHKKIPNKKALQWLSTTYQPFAELIDDLALMMAGDTVKQFVKSDSDYLQSNLYEKCLDELRTTLIEKAGKAALHIEAALEKRHEILKTISALKHKTGLKENVSDIKAQLDFLFAPHVVQLMPYALLSAWANFVKGLEVRLERLEIQGVQKDSQWMAEANVLEDKIALIRAKAKTCQEKRAVQHIEWQMQSYRLMLFAPNIPRPEKVTAKVIQKQISTLDSH